MFSALIVLLLNLWPIKFHLSQRVFLLLLLICFSNIQSISWNWCCYYIVVCILSTYSEVEFSISPVHSLFSTINSIALHHLLLFLLQFSFFSSYLILMHVANMNYFHCIPKMHAVYMIPFGFIERLSFCVLSTWFF